MVPQYVFKTCCLYMVVVVGGLPLYSDAANVRVYMRAHTDGPGFLSFSMYRVQFVLRALKVIGVLVA